MRKSSSFVYLSVLAIATFCLRSAVSGQSLSIAPERALIVKTAVNTFMQAVAQGVTKEGPTAWSQYFADDPAFFMAVDGHLVFPDNAAASAGIHQAAIEIKHIDLVWGTDLRVDPLTPDLAVVATSWKEVQVNAAGKRKEEAGFFTGVAEYRKGRWQLRDAHWSLVPPASPAP
jgi:hypothetical protein